MTKIYVVVCDQSYASFHCVVGVYSTRKKAEKEAAKMSDYKVEEYTLNKKLEEL